MLSLNAAQADAIVRLHDAGATSPQSAKSVSSDDALYLQSVLVDGLVREAGAGRFYVDDQRYAQWKADSQSPPSMAPRTLATLALAGAAALAIIAWFFTRTGG